MEEEVIPAPQPPHHQGHPFPQQHQQQPQKSTSQLPSSAAQP